MEDTDNGRPPISGILLTDGVMPGLCEHLRGAEGGSPFLDGIGGIGIREGATSSLEGVVRFVHDWSFSFNTLGQRRLCGTTYALSSKAARVSLNWAISEIHSNCLLKPLHVNIIYCANTKNTIN